MKRRKALKPKFAHGNIEIENLPYPIVHYPNHYGTFFSYSKQNKQRSKKVIMCSCNEPIIENYLELKRRFPEQLNANPLRMAPLDSWFFNNEIAEKSRDAINGPLSTIEFESKICHRCNMASPKLRYCHEMYGGEFKQHFGWFINQTYLRLGIFQRHNPRLPFPFMDDLCPNDMQSDIFAIREAYNAVDGKSKATGFNYMSSIDKDVTRNQRNLERKIESITRQEFGFRKVGDGWVSETLLYQIVCRLLPNQEVIRHYRPPWLNGLELDVYIPELKLAFEYQGQQHFHSIKAWGGDKALAQLKLRDKTKKEICNRLSLMLVLIDYTDPLNDDFIKNLIFV